MQAHAIGDNATRLGCRGDHLAARAHTKGIDAPAVRRMTDQFVGSGTKGRMAGKGTILGAVDHPAGVFDADAHCKGFLLHANPLGKQCLNRVAGGMADAEEDGVCPELGTFSGMAENRAFDMLVTDDEFFQTGLEQDGAAEGDDLFPNGSYDTFQPIGADVRFLVDKDLFRRTVCHEGFQDVSHMRAFNAAGQFSIRKRACSAFPKLDIGFGIEDAAFLKEQDILCAPVDRLAAFDKNRVCSGPGEGQGCKETGGTGANNKGR